MPERSTPEHLEMSRISAWVIPSALITIRLNDSFDMDAVVHRWEEDPDLLKAGSGALIHGLLDAVVDDQFEWIETLDNRMEDLAGDLFAQRQVNAMFARTIFDVRRELVTLRRIVLPMREVVAGLVRDPAMASPTLRPWFDDLYDHVLRAGEWTESLRDLVSSAFKNLALNDERLNTIMKKLAGWAAIIAVPTAIAGWFGQNVPTTRVRRSAGPVALGRAHRRVCRHALPGVQGPRLALDDRRSGPALRHHFHNSPRLRGAPSA